MNANQIYKQILKLRKMDNVYTEWTKYRNQLTDYLIHNTEENKSIAVFGAGGCNDLDLNKMSQHYSKLFLIDNDINSVNEAIKRYKLEAYGSLEIINADFVGITEEDYESYINIFITELTKNPQKPDINLLTEKLMLCMDDIYSKISKYQISISPDIADYSVAVGVHSQLNNMLEWMWSVFMGSYLLTNGKITQRVSAENEYIVHKLNSTIIRSTKKEIFIGCERNIVGRNILVEGAYQAINDLKHRGKEDLLCFEDKFKIVWPFDKKRSLSYNLDLYKIKLKNKI